MTTNFALSLSFDGIDLLHRAQQGWQVIGTANVEDPDLDTTLAGMRKKAQALAPDGLLCRIVIPADQIKYLAIDTTQTDLDDIHAALDGLTPYALEELVIDYERSGGRTHIAAVARETLQEAEAFARGHGFNPVCFVAVPEPFTFREEVFFGPSAMMPALLGPDGVVARDAEPVQVTPPPLAPVLQTAPRTVVPDDYFSDEHEDIDDLDLTALLARGAAASLAENISAAPSAPGTDAALADGAGMSPAAQPEHRSDAALGDLFSDLGGPTKAGIAPQTPPQPDPIHMDAIIAEYYTPSPVPPAIKAPPVAISDAGIDRIITEYHPVSPPKAPALQLVAPKVDRRPPQPAPKRRRPLLAVAAIAAAIALAVGLIWSQAEQVTTEPQPQVTATPPQPEASAAPLPDISPMPPQQRVIALTPPRTSALSVETPGVFAPPITPDLPVLQTPGAADAPLADVQTPPTQDETAANTPVQPGQVLSPDEAARIYAATGVWQRAPRFVSTPRTEPAAGVTVPAVPPAPARITRPDGAALTVDQTDQSFIAPANPPPADVTFLMDENGFILATPEGTLTPEGAIVVAGLPDITLRVRPELSADDLARMAALAPAPEGVVVLPGPPAVVPPLRPDDIAPPSAGGVALSALTPTEDAAPEGETIAATDPAQPALRPRLRPSGIAQPEEPTDITSVIAGIDAESSDAFIDLTPGAADPAVRPELRPQNFARVVEIARARQQPTPDTTTSNDQASFEVTLPQSTAPVPGGVARAATQENVIGLRDINLIGVYGRPNARRALVRLSNGRYVRVEVGSTLDGGEVTAIGDSALNYVKRGRTYSLEMPAG